MTSAKVLIIGSNSDLIQPFITQASSNNILTLCLGRQEWDLENPLPPPDVLSRIESFSPQHIVYAAGTNQLLTDFTDTHFILKELDVHFRVNCTSLIAISFYLARTKSLLLSSIHAISSLYGLYGRKSRLPYSISKHALEGAIKCLSLELPSTVVLGYRPGFFRTKLTDQNLSLESQESIIKKIPIGRLGTPAELTSCILTNILNPPLYASGSSITFDGGLTAGGLFEI